jgi:V8-like Glu-specific endopeptidase
MKILINNREVDFEVFRAYIRAIWNFQYSNDRERQRLHEAIFEAVGIDRYDSDDFDHPDYKTHQTINHILMYAGIHCKTSVDRNNRCSECGYIVDTADAVAQMELYCKRINIIKE